jgi:hypothetical protein
MSTALEAEDERQNDGNYDGCTSKSDGSCDESNEALILSLF